MRRDRKRERKRFELTEGKRLENLGEINRKEERMNEIEREIGGKKLRRKKKEKKKERKRERERERKKEKNCKKEQGGFKILNIVSLFLLFFS